MSTVSPGELPLFLQPESRSAAAIAYGESARRVVPLHGVRPFGDDWVCDCRKGPVCRKAGKHPIFRNWYEVGSDSVNTIETWWRKFPNANVGLLTGQREFAVDLDPRNGSEQSLEALEHRFGSLPATATVRTGGGGEHRLFTYPTDLLICGSRSLPVVDGLPGVDVQGRGHLIVAPPSRHVSGNLYEWINWPQGGPVPPPDWLIDGAPVDPSALPCPEGVDPYGWAVLLDECLLVSEAERGSRNKKLHLAAAKVGQVIDGASIDREEALELLYEAGVSSGLDHVEVKDVVQRGLRWGQDHPRALRPPIRNREEALAQLEEIRDVFVSLGWKGHRGRRVVRVFEALYRIAQRAGGPGNFGGGTRRIAIEAGTENLAMVTRALLELREEGWLLRLVKGRNKKPSRWRLRIPENTLQSRNLDTPPVKPLVATVQQRRPAAIGHDAFRNSVPANAEVSETPFGDKEFVWVPRGLGTTRWRLYTHLLEIGERLTQAELAGALGIARSTVSRNIKLLLELGLLDEHEKRYHAVGKTDPELDLIATQLRTRGAARKQRESYGWTLEGLPETRSDLSRGDLGDGEEADNVA